MITLDDWQREFLNTKGNKLLVSGRQVGKSTIVAIDAGEFVLNSPNKQVLIISKTERQAHELFLKTLLYIMGKAPSMIRQGKDRPTKQILKLKNGSIIRSLPTGMEGTGIRGYTIHRLIADEAAFIETEVFNTVTPMLTTTAGDIILLSTPHGRAGYFYDMYKCGDFKVFHVNSEEVIRSRKICASWTEEQRDATINFLESEKKRMSALMYAQEYGGQFVDELRQYFLSELIRKCCILKRPEGISRNSKHYLGVDLARMGGDESVFSVLKVNDAGICMQVDNEIMSRIFTTENEKRILEISLKYGDTLKKIGLDAGAGTLGVSILDHLLETNIAHKLVALDNAKRKYSSDKTRQVGIFKEDLYDNLRAMMERGEIQLLSDDEIMLSLKSVQFEYQAKEGAAAKLKIFGNYTHCVEALIRAAWLARESTKHLNLWCYYS